MMLELDKYLGRYQVTYVHIQYIDVYNPSPWIHICMGPREAQKNHQLLQKEGLPQRRKTMRKEMGENLACVAGTMEE